MRSKQRLVIAALSIAAAVVAAPSPGLCLGNGGPDGDDEAQAAQGGEQRMSALQVIKQAMAAKRAIVAQQVKTQEARQRANEQHQLMVDASEAAANAEAAAQQAAPDAPNTPNLKKNAVALRQRARFWADQANTSAESARAEETQMENMQIDQENWRNRLMAQKRTRLLALVGQAPPRRPEPKRDVIRFEEAPLPPPEAEPEEPPVAEHGPEALPLGIVGAWRLGRILLPNNYTPIRRRVIATPANPQVANYQAIVVNNAGQIQSQYVQLPSPPVPANTGQAPVAPPEPPSSSGH